MPARPTSSRLPALGAILGFALVRLVTRRGGTPAHHGPARAEPHAEEPERKPSNSAPSSHEASREPGRGREATSPTEIPARGWKDIFWRVYEEINKDRILAVAAGVTFYGLLGLFPALAALVSIYGLFADPATIQDHLNLLSGVLPGGALDIIGEQVKRITSKGSGTLGFTFFSGLAISLWSANAGVKAVFDALNVAYGEEEKRGFIALNLRSLAFTLGMIVFALVAIGAIVVVPVLLNFIGLGKVTEWIISLALSATRIQDVVAPKPRTLLQHLPNPGLGPARGFGHRTHTGEPSDDRVHGLLPSEEPQSQDGMAGESLPPAAQALERRGIGTRSCNRSMMQVHARRHAALDHAPGRHPSSRYH